MKHAYTPGIAAALLAVLALCLTASSLLAQGETTSAIVGRVRDGSGAAIPGARVSVVEEATGQRRTSSTNAAGSFDVPQLLPGLYTVRAEAPGFAPQVQAHVDAGLGQKQTVNLTLSPASSNQTVEVTGVAPLINPASPNTVTNLSAPALENLPNPGSDLTYPLQFASGALINTAGSSNDFVGGSNGYGNVEFNGLPATSNGYIVDGLETNDPLTNLNSGLATNLVLGLNSIAQVTVNTLSYGVDQGLYGASQVNYVTKSGGNRFHGNLYEQWNGAVLNAADFFTNATPGNHKPGSVVNHFGGSLGGPLLHNKLFFFVDSEWVRIALPIFTPITVPTPAFESYVLGQLPKGGTDAVTGSTYAPEPAEVPFYQNMFGLYGALPDARAGTPLAILGCPLETGGGLAAGTPPNGDGCALRQNVSHSSDDSEQVQTLRLDYDASSTRSYWLRLQADTGLQAAYTDPINSTFDAISSQPLYSIAAGFTQVFSPNLVNYFNPGFSWYESLFGPDQLQQTLANFPIVLQGAGANVPFTTMGGLDNTWVQGRRAGRLFLNDNLAWSRGAHEFRFGVNTRVFRLNDYDFGEGAVPTVTVATLPQYIYGVASTTSQTFATSANEPYNFVNFGAYAQDTWGITPRLTWTIGLRSSTNTNPLNPHDQVARLTGSFDSIAHDPNQPLNAAITTGLGHLFAATPLALLQPRSALAWQFSPHTLVHGGFGVFSDLMPGSIADLIGANPPYVRTLTGGLLGTVGGVSIAPGVPGSAIAAVESANQNFGAGFSSGELSCAAPQANPAGCLPPAAITAVPNGTLHAPYFMQWSLGVEHQFGTNTALRAQYVGTRAVNQPYLTQVNGYQTVCAGCFASFPYQRPADPRFGAVTQFQTGANSNYNGLQVTAVKRISHGLQGQLDYTWSHCLDTVSNGGLLPFSAGGILEPLPGELGRDYGPCDYDIRHNLTAQYSYSLPFKKPGAWGVLGNGWQVAGTIFWHTGVPFSVLSSPYSANGNGVIQAAGPQFASVVPGVPLYDHNPITGVTQPGTIQWLNPNAFVSTVDPSTGACVGGDTPATCQFGTLGRNALRGPNFFWSDFDLTRSVLLRGDTKLRFDAQFYNIFNHPNFALPSVIYAGVPGQPSTQTGFGALTTTTSPPTGLLGVGLGGDSSARMVSLQVRLEF
ncbi:MAG: carboxypeptidase regulatory-like domain-containing protein [Terriglobales bacterium]